MSDIVQVNLEIPDKIRKGLTEGIYERNGGIVRKAINKQIVAHLDEVNINDTDEIKNQALAKLKNSQVAIGLAGALILAGSASLIYINKKEKEKKKIKIQEEFNHSFNKYMENAKKGKLSEEIVEDFKNKLIEFENILSNNVEFDEELKQNLNILTELIQIYTSQFARVNKFDVEIKQKKNNEVKDNIILLKDYLNIQENIFKKSKST